MVSFLRPPAIQRDLVLKVIVLWLLVIYGFWVSRYLLPWNKDVHVQDVNLDNEPTYSIQPIVPVDDNSLPIPHVETEPKQQAANFSDKIIVVGKTMSEDTTWVEEELPE